MITLVTPRVPVSSLHGRLADELRVVRDELHARGWTFLGWRPTDNGAGQFIAQQDYGGFALADTAVGLLLAVQQHGQQNGHRDNGEADPLRPPVRS